MNLNLVKLPATPATFDYPDMPWLESNPVLVTNGMNWHIASYREYNEEYDGSGRKVWIVTGPDGYELENVLAWAELPSPKPKQLTANQE